MERPIRKQCEGAVTYDRNLGERKIRCKNETGDPTLRLCAGCRVTEKLEEQRRTRIMTQGLEAMRETLAKVAPPAVRSTSSSSLAAKFAAPTESEEPREQQRSDSPMRKSG